MAVLPAPVFPSSHTTSALDWARWRASLASPPASVPPLANSDSLTAVQSLSRRPTMCPRTARRIRAIGRGRQPLYLMKIPACAAAPFFVRSLRGLKDPLRTQGRQRRSALGCRDKGRGFLAATLGPRRAQRPLCYRDPAAAMTLRLAGAP